MKQPVEKNMTLDVTIMDLTYEGFGVAKVDGFPIFIENALPEEEISIQIVKVLKKFAFGKVLEFKKESVDRVPLTDAVGTRVGTMPLQHMAYPLQLSFKRQQVIDSLTKVMDIDGIEIFETQGMDNPWEYRNKAQVPVRMVNGVLETGFFKRGSHDFVPVENFHIQDPKIDEAIIIIRNILRDLEIPAYDEKKHKGIIRHVMVRRGYYTGEVMVILVTNVKDFENLDVLTERIMAEVPGIVSLVQNMNMKQTNVILGRKTRVLSGEDFYRDELMGKTFNISSHSFYQVNPRQTEHLYQTAIDLANVTDTDTVVDAYCGIGTISLSLAQSAKHVYGMDIIGDAITMARKNAEENSIKNATFEAGPAEDVLKFWLNEGLVIDVLVVDPPRKGLDPEFIEHALNSNPERIVYVSCNPATLARDLVLLQEGGYKVESVQPVDMFPQTTHVEAVTLLVKER